MASSQSDSLAPQPGRSPQGKRYSEQFKRDALRLITHEHYSFPAAAKAVKVSYQTMRDWYAKFHPPIEPSPEGASVDELMTENKRLREQLRRAEMEREILKKAAAYFAKESM